MVNAAESPERAPLRRESGTESPTELDEAAGSRESVKPPEQKRRRILEAAAQLFASQGFAKTRVEEISARAHVSKGLVYVHFLSKEALLEAVLSNAIIEWGKAIRKAAGHPDFSPSERIAAVLRSSIEHAEKRPILRTLLAQDPRDLLPAEHNHADRLAAAYTRDMEGLLRRGIERGALRADLDVAYAAKAVWLLHSALIREFFIAPVTSTRADADRLADAAIDMILSGFIARPIGDDPSR